MYQYCDPMKKLSIAIAVYNEEKTLPTCLDHVSSWVDEVIIVDGGSTDKTAEVARRYGAKIIHADNPPIFHINKQKAVDACRSEWILQLDADEIVTEALQQEILGIIRTGETNKEAGYFIPRKNYFLGRWMQKGGLYPDYVIRFFKRTMGKFPSKSVHEQIAIDGSVGYLKNPILHYPYETIPEYFRKANTYSALAARDLSMSHTVVTVVTVVTYLFVKPVATVVSLLIRHKGILDGPWGILFAVFSAVQHPMALIKYMKGNYGV